MYNVEPEYTTMSRRPGIGRGWFEKYQTDVFPSDEVPVPGQGVIKGTPRYYDEIFRVEDPEGFERVQELREAFRKSHGHDYTPQRLMAKYKVKKRQVEFLKRELE